ncbi:hypothetical protein [Vagococcus sp.]|uniref:hypothetical protein n=1 Tax=Vagococcus sp. TaxID=1933889 RepID=UPI003F99E5D3
MRKVKIQDKVKWLILISLLIVGIYGGYRLGKHGFFTEKKTTQETQIIKTLSKEKQIVLVNLGISEIYSREKSLKLFEADVVGTGKNKYMQAHFDAKLGIDGKKVKIENMGNQHFKIKVPEFIFIGHDNEKFEVIVEDGGILSWLTPEIDETEMVNQILNRKSQLKYIKKYESLLKESSQEFYGNLIKSIDPDAKITVEFPEEIK